ncbi:MAG: beta-lactamase family protein [Gemmatimonadetes bacterium]|nr:beta-lactamase family protein [Gemmatimonadota bacterium]
MRLRLIPFCILLAVSAAPLNAQAPSRTELVARIDSIVTAAMGPSGAPGLGVAVVRGGDTIVLRGYGLADVENGVAVTDRSVFRIGSITKQFTSAAVMKLVEEGRVRLDAPLSEYLPDYRGPGSSVTVHQLLNHTSGIPSYTGLGERFWSRSRLDLTHEEMLALFAADSLEFQPGSRWAYNNSGYYLLGMLIESVTGMSYADHLRTTQFEPLGLTQTLYCDVSRVVPHRVSGYDEADGRIVNAAPLSMNAPGAAGALCSTARDLIRWARALHAGDVVGASSYGTMTAPTALSGGSSQAYGYGLMMTQIGEHDAVAHGGGINGFNSYMSHIPGEDLTIAVLSNGPTNAGQVHGRIARAMLGLPEPVAEQPAEVEIDEAALLRYVGRYDLAPAVPLQVELRVEGGRLVGQATGQPPIPLRFAGDHTFLGPAGSGIRMVFTVEGERAPSFMLHQGGAEILAVRME